MMGLATRRRGWGHAGLGWGHVGGGWNGGGGCQGWLSRVAAVVVAAACTGQRQPIFVAGTWESGPGLGTHGWQKRRRGCVQEVWIGDGACVLTIGHHCHGG